MNLTDWVVGNLKPYKLALNSPTRIGSFLPTIYGCVLPTLTIYERTQREIAALFGISQVGVLKRIERIKKLFQ